LISPRLHGIKLILSDILFAISIIAGLYLLWMRMIHIFDFGFWGMISVFIEYVIIIATLIYMITFLYKTPPKKELKEIQSVSGSVDVFVIVDNKQIEAVNDTIESINNLDTNFNVYKFLVCEKCGKEIEIYASEKKIMLLKDNPDKPINASGIKLALMKSEAKYVLFVNTGTLLAKNYLKKTIPHFIDKNVCVVQPARKITFERVVNLKEIPWFPAKLFALVGISDFRFDILSDDMISFRNAIQSGKRFSPGAWNGVIIERDVFTGGIAELIPEENKDVSLFEDLDDDTPIITSDDDSEVKVVDLEIEESETKTDLPAGEKKGSGIEKDETDAGESEDESEEKVEPDEKNEVLNKIPVDFRYMLEVFNNPEKKSVLLAEYLLEKKYDNGFHNRLLFETAFFDKILNAFRMRKYFCDAGLSKENSLYLAGTLAGYLASFTLYFWGLFLVFVVALDIQIIDEGLFLKLLPALSIFIITLEIRSLIIKGGGGFLAKYKRIVLTPFYTGIIKIREYGEGDKRQVEKSAGYLRVLLLSLTFTAIVVSVIKIYFYYEPRLNLFLLLFFLFFFAVLGSTLVIFLSVTKEENSGDS